MSETIDSTPTLDEAPPRRLVRSDEGRWLGGVCAGLGRYFDINPLVYRIAFAALSLAGGTGLLLYLAAYLVIPDEHADESIAVEKMRTRRDQPWLLLGVGLLGFGALFALSEASFWPGNGNFWFAAVLAGAALVWWRVSSRDRQPSTARPRRDGAPTPAGRTHVQAAEEAVALRTRGRCAPRGVGRVRPARGAGHLRRRPRDRVRRGCRDGRRCGRDRSDDAAARRRARPPRSGPAGRVRGRRCDAGLDLGRRGREDRTAFDSRRARAELRARPRILELDLRAVELPPGTTSIDASVGVGELVITVPEGVALEIDTHAGAGEIDILGDLDDGFSVDRTLSVAGPTPDAPVLQLEADMGFGAIEVRRG